MGQYHKFPCADGLAVAFEPISATLRGLQYTIVYYLVLIAQKKRYKRNLARMYLLYLKLNITRFKIFIRFMHQTL